MTLIEIMVVSVIGVVVLTVLITLSTSSAKLNKAAQTSVSLQAALLIEESLAADMRQLGVVPGRGPVQTSARGATFYRCVFDAKSIRYRPVKYSCEKTPGGNWRLIRTEGLPSGPRRQTLDGILADILFRQISDPVLGQVYLRVTMRLIDDDVPLPTTLDAFAARVTQHDIVCKLTIPSEFPLPRVTRTTKPILESDLLPLN